MSSDRPDPKNAGKPAEGKGAHHQETVQEAATKPKDQEVLLPGSGFQPEPGVQMGRYRIGRRIGSGGMGIVFEAEDTKLKRKVARRCRGRVRRSRASGFSARPKRRARSITPTRSLRTTSASTKACDTSCSSCSIRGARKASF